MDDWNEIYFNYLYKIIINIIKKKFLLKFCYELLDQI